MICMGVVGELWVECELSVCCGRVAPRKLKLSAIRASNGTSGDFILKFSFAFESFHRGGGFQASPVRTFSGPHKVPGQNFVGVARGAALQGEEFGGGHDASGPLVAR
jgi:hypothetical protein